MTLSTSAVAVCCCSDFAQLVEQPRVLDGDDGLGGEVRDQLDLLVSERPDLLAVDADDADQAIVLEHRHDQDRSSATEISRRRQRGIALEIRRTRPHVGNLGELFRPGDTRPMPAIADGADNVLAPSGLGVFGGTLCMATFRNTSPS